MNLALIIWDFPTFSSLLCSGIDRMWHVTPIIHDRQKEQEDTANRKLLLINKFFALDLEAGSVKTMVFDRGFIRLSYYVVSLPQPRG